MIRSGLLALLLLAVIPIAGRALPEPDERYQVRVKVSESTKKPKIIADAVMVLAKDGTARLIQGGELPADNPADVRQFGLIIGGTLRDDGKRLSLKIDISSKIQVADKTATVICGQYIDLQMNVEPGIKKRFHCDADRWCEVLVERL